MGGVLDNLRVLDLSWGIAGPMTTMLLADHGADVTRIEPPGGDPFRSQPGYRVWNRGKRSAVLDLKQKADLDAFLALASQADILVETFSPGTTKRLGIDYETLHALNPRLIYCSITAYGRDNEHSNRPGYDALVAARLGVQWEHRGWPGGADNRLAGLEPYLADVEVPYEMVQGPPRTGPLFMQSAYPSVGAFFSASVGISAALRAREVIGHGQWVETSLLQGALAASGASWQRAENPDAKFYRTWVSDSRAPKGHFQCSDGRWIHQWSPFPRFIFGASEGDKIDSNPDLTLKDHPERFGMGPEELLVMLHYQELMAERVKKFPAADWVKAAADAMIPLQEARSLEESLNDPLLLSDGCVTEVKDPEVGAIRHVGITYKLDTSKGHIRGPAPTLGQHTAAVKAEAEAASKAPRKTATATGKKLGAPLEGITVLDLGLAVAGPYGCQLLADLGANVIKVNALHDGYWHSTSIAFCANRGKSSIALNLKDPRAIAILHELVQKADVVQHNMRYDAAERLGVDYESLKKVNPKLIYCHTRGFERGERQPLPGNDQMGGCLAGVQHEDGAIARGGKAFWSLTSFGDTGNGFLSAVAIVQALYHRDKTGVGQFVDTAIVNAQLLVSSNAYAFPDGTSPERPRIDAMHLGFSALYRLYSTADGWICLAAVNDEHWDHLCAALVSKTLATDPRFATAASRAANDGALAEHLTAIFAERSASQWFTLLDKAGVPVEISSGDFALKLHDDPEMIKRKWTVTYHQDAVGQMSQFGLFFDFSETPGKLQGPPLIVGYDTRKILMNDLGRTDAEVDQLCAAGIVLDGRQTHAAHVASPWAKKE